MPSRPLSPSLRRVSAIVVVGLLLTAIAGPALAGVVAEAESGVRGSAIHETGGEASLILPDLSSIQFLGTTPGNSLLTGGLVVCLLGLVFGLVIFRQLRSMPVHKSMLEIS